MSTSHSKGQLTRLVGQLLAGDGSGAAANKLLITNEHFQNSGRPGPDLVQLLISR